MFDINAILWLTFLSFIGFYWLGALRAKEIAHSAAEKHCDEMQVQLLDQSVYLKKLWFKRNTQGHLQIWRQFNFEFSSTGDERYTGKVITLGRKTLSVQLDAHRLH